MPTLVTRSTPSAPLPTLDPLVMDTRLFRAPHLMGTHRIVCNEGIRLLINCLLRCALGLEFELRSERVSYLKSNSTGIQSFC